MKILDYSVVGASSLLAISGALNGFKAFKGKEYKKGAMITLGVIVAGYAFTYALAKIQSPAAPVVVLEKIATPVETK